MSKLYYLFIFSLLSAVLATQTNGIYEPLSNSEITSDSPFSSFLTNISNNFPIPISDQPLEALKNMIERPTHFLASHSPGPQAFHPASSVKNGFLRDTAFPFLANLFGFIFMVLSVVLLWFNEKKAVDMARIVNYGEKACEEANPEQYDAELNGELVHVFGKISTQRQLHDQSFGIMTQDCIKLKRVVEVYQMREYKLNQASPFHRTSYKYEPGWCEFLNQSVMFKQEDMKQANNKVKFVAHGLTFNADNVDLGCFKLTPYQIERLDNWVPLELSGESAGTNFSRDLKERINGLNWEKAPVIQVNENCLRIKQGDGEEPQIGDIRVSFYKIPCDSVTIISEQAGITFKPYNIKEKRFIRKSEEEKPEGRFLDDEDVRFDQVLEKSVDRCCWSIFCGWSMRTSFRNPLRVRETVDWIYPGKISKKEFFNNQIKIENRYLTAVLRILVTVFLTIGIYLEFGGNIRSLAVIRWLGDFVGYAFLLGNIGSGFLAAILVAGFAWMFYKRTVGFGIVLWAASIVGIVYVCEKLEIA